MLKHKIARPDVGRPRRPKTTQRKKEKTTAPRNPLAESTAKCKSQGNLEVA